MRCLSPNTISMKRWNGQVLVRMIYITLAFLISTQLAAQPPKKDKAIMDIDTTINYDEFFSALDDFIDSLYAPHSFAVINIGIGNNYFNYTNTTHTEIDVIKKVVFNPSIAYYHKNGLGISASASMVNIANQYDPYQYAISGSYDYIKNYKWATGLSFTHFFTKEDLPFYTSPLNSQASAYITYRRGWIKPMLAVNYGWGNRTDYNESSTYIKLLKLKKQKPLRNVTNTTITTSQEHINDFSVTASARHDFYWLHILNEKDYARLTPQITFTGGTQKFGFNAESNSYISSSATGMNILYDSKNANLNSTTGFRPLAVTAFVKTEYNVGKFFVQPQVMIDYYIPASSDNITTAYSINTGLIF